MTKESGLAHLIAVMFVAVHLIARHTFAEKSAIPWNRNLCIVLFPPTLLHIAHVVKPVYLIFSSPRDRAVKIGSLIAKSRAGISFSADILVLCPVIPGLVTLASV